jgi:hypothetical protein
MLRCAATSKTGKKCLNAARYGNYCFTHKVNNDNTNLVAVGLGGLAGALAAPGLLPIALGAAAGKVVKDVFFTKEASVAKKRVFVSFDFDNDQSLKHLIIGQARNPDLDFDVSDHSLKEAAPERDWVDKARRAIGRSELVLVVVGANTYRAPGVLKEVQMAREMGVKVVQIIGYKDRTYTPVKDAGRLYSWSHGNLKSLLS